MLNQWIAGCSRQWRGDRCRGRKTDRVGHVIPWSVWHFHLDRTSWNFRNFSSLLPATCHDSLSPANICCPQWRRPRPRCNSRSASSTPAWPSSLRKTTTRSNFPQSSSPKPSRQAPSSTSPSPKTPPKKKQSTQHSSTSKPLFARHSPPDRPRRPGWPCVTQRRRALCWSGIRLISPQQS